MSRKKHSTNKQMVKRLISVPKETDERLKRLRQEEGISQWFFIRNAIDAALNQHDAQKRYA